MIKPFGVPPAGDPAQAPQPPRPHAPSDTRSAPRLPAGPAGRPGHPRRPLPLSAGAVRASSIFPILSVTLLFFGGLCVAASELHRSRHNVILSAGIFFVSAGECRPPLPDPSSARTPSPAGATGTRRCCLGDKPGAGPAEGGMKEGGGAGVARPLGEAGAERERTGARTCKWGRAVDSKGSSLLAARRPGPFAACVPVN